MLSLGVVVCMCVGVGVRLRWQRYEKSNWSISSSVQMFQSFPAVMLAQWRHCIAPRLKEHSAQQLVLIIDSVFIDSSSLKLLHNSCQCQHIA